MPHADAWVRRAASARMGRGGRACEVWNSPYNIAPRLKPGLRLRKTHGSLPKPKSWPKKRATNRKMSMYSEATIHIFWKRVGLLEKQATTDAYLRQAIGRYTQRHTGIGFADSKLVAKLLGSAVEVG